MDVEKFEEKWERQGRWEHAVGSRSIWSYVISLSNIWLARLGLILFCLLDRFLIVILVGNEVRDMVQNRADRLSAFKVLWLQTATHHQGTVAAASQHLSESSSFIRAVIWVTDGGSIFCTFIRRPCVTQKWRRKQMIWNLELSDLSIIFISFIWDNAWVKEKLEIFELLDQLCHLCSKNWTVTGRRLIL